MNCSVAVLGPEGSFSDAAASVLKVEKKKAAKIYADSFAKIFKMVLDGKASFGFVPLSNSLHGKIQETQKLLKKYEHELRKERILKRNIQLCLAAPKGTSFAEIHQLFLVPYVEKQCGNFLANMLPKVNIRRCKSTSASLALAAAAMNSAAVGSLAGAKIFKLKILARNIQNSKKNVTTFLLFSLLPKLALLRRDQKAPSSNDTIRETKRRRTESQKKSY